MIYIKNILKIIALIIIIKANFLVSFAFLSDDMGIDLYKNIDKGINELQSTQYSYELKGADEGSTIDDKVNQILISENLGDCKVSNLNENDIQKISSGDIKLLSKKVDKKCNDISKISRVQQRILIYSKDTMKKAKRKAKEIYSISKIGLYSDGNIKNSPFDIIQDIKDIDSIIFTQELEYEGEVNIGDDELADFIKGKLDDFENNLNNENNDKGKPKDDKNKNNTNKAEDIPTNQEDDINKDGYMQIEGDKTQNSCPTSSDESGLSKEDLDNILNSPDDIYNNSSNHNKGKREGYDFSFAFSTSDDYDLGLIGINIGTNNYKKVNDNKFWGGKKGCNKFFCITIEFITHKGNLLGGGKTQSIESILEKSNKHLKKMTNTSLVQSKMTTNNFELGLRDLNFPDILSMGVVVTKRTPPILNLQKFNDKVKNKKKKDNKNDNDEDSLSVKNRLNSRFNAIGMNSKRENDLSIYYDRDAQQKSVEKSAELDILNVTKNSKKRIEALKDSTKMNTYLDKVVESQSQSDDTEVLYKEFLELERFVAEIQNYADNFNNISQGMLEIPIHP